VTEGRLRPIPAERDVPAWVRRAVLRGLKADPAQRWPSMAPLIAALTDDPAARHRRRLLLGASLVLLALGVLALAQVLDRRRREVEREVGRHLQEATRAAATGRTRAADVRDLRQRAFDAFDAADRARGEAAWREALALVPEALGAFQRAERAYDTALVLDPARAEARDDLADVAYEHIRLAEELRHDDEARALAALLERHDAGGRRRAALERTGALMLRAAPVTASVSLERYEVQAASGRRVARPAPVSLVPGTRLALPAGSYRAVVRAPGYVETMYPFEMASGQSLDVSIRLPPAAAVPAGFVYVPPGDFWFGDGDEGLRTKFLDTVPIHRQHTGAYLIARRETTYRDWIDFLEALPEEQRARHAPRISAPLRGSLRLREVGESWELTFLQRTSLRYAARAGEPFVYVGRNRRARQDWLDFPVAGTAPADAERYLRWLRETGRVPGARLCTELEWERAARGADDRVYPHGDDLAADDANFDVTYGRVDSAFGPDAVGAHPASRSPFGVDDLAGNVLELVRSSLDPGGYVIRGGAYYFNSATCRLTNRNSVPSTFRDVTSGIRVCASTGGTP